MNGRRTRVPNGEYRPCPTWGCRNGQIKVGKSGQRVPHQRCGGDGYIKVGTKKKGRGRARPPRGKRPFTGAVASHFGWCGVFIVGLGQTFGTVGHILGIVLAVAFTVLKVVAFVARVGAR